jgi:hypothetical protein
VAVVGRFVEDRRRTVVEPDQVIEVLDVAGA